MRLLGDDVFISYSRRDGALYAAGLADKLTEKKLSCFIDKLGVKPNHDLPPDLIKKIKNCTVFVLVGTENAARSGFVKKEIAEFKQTGRTILPIDFDGKVGKAIWYEEIPGLAVEPEKNPEALETGNPSQNVVGFIEKSFKYTRRNQYTFRMFWGAILLFVLLTGLGTGSYLFAKQEADRQTIRAEEATKKAIEQEQIAKDKQALADTATKKAEEQAKKADQAEKRAAEQEELAAMKEREAIAATEKAAVAAKLADEKTRLANTETKRANTQQSIAEATQLSNESNSFLNQNNPAVLKSAFDNAITANRKVDTNGLSLTEPISSLRRILSFAPTVIPKTSLSLPKMDFSCENFAVSTNQISFACQNGNKVKIYQILNPDEEPKEFDFNDHLVKQDVGKNVQNADETLSPPCLYNTNEQIESKISHLSVSDDGKVVALSITDDNTSEDEEGDDIYNGYRIVVKNSNQKPSCQTTDNVAFLSLSPTGESLIYAGVNSSQGDDDLDISRLNLWKIESNSEVLDCAYTSQIQTMLNGSFSPDGKRYVTLNNNLTKPSVVEIHEFLIDKQKKPAICTETPLVDTDSNSPSEYFLRSYDIDIKYGVSSIAVNNSGNRIAIGSNGISVWDIYSYPQLKIMIPSQSSLNASLLLDENLSSKQKNLTIVIKDKTHLINETWSIEGYKGEICPVCEQIGTLSQFNEFSETHPEFKAEIKGTEVTILRKSDLAVVDYIVLDEKIEDKGVVFSQDGNEIITESYDASPIGERVEQLNGYREHHYKKWIIGYKNLVEVIKTRLPQFNSNK